MLLGREQPPAPLNKEAASFHVAENLMLLLAHWFITLVQVLVFFNETEWNTNLTLHYNTRRVYSTM